MKHKKLLMLAAILIGGFTLTSCGDYEFGCVSRIPFKVYNSKGEKICDHSGAVTVTQIHRDTIYY